MASRNVCAYGSSTPLPRPMPAIPKEILACRRSRGALAIRSGCSTPARVAQMFGVDPKTVARWASAGKLGSLAPWAVTADSGRPRFRTISCPRAATRPMTAELAVRGAPPIVQGPKGRKARSLAHLNHPPARTPLTGSYTTPLPLPRTSGVSWESERRSESGSAGCVRWVVVDGRRDWLPSRPTGVADLQGQASHLRRHTVGELRPATSQAVAAALLGSVIGIDAPSPGRPKPDTPVKPASFPRGSWISGSRRGRACRLRSGSSCPF